MKKFNTYLPGFAYIGTQQNFDIYTTEDRGRVFCVLQTAEQSWMRVDTTITPKEYWAPEHKAALELFEASTTAKFSDRLIQLIKYSKSNTIGDFTYEGISNALSQHYSYCPEPGVVLHHVLEALKEALLYSKYFEFPFGGDVMEKIIGSPLEMFSRANVDREKMSNHQIIVEVILCQIRSIMTLFMLSSTAWCRTQLGYPPITAELMAGELEKLKKSREAVKEVA